MNARAGEQLLRDLLADFPEQDGLARGIRDCEHEGDRLARATLLRLAERGARACALEAPDVHALTGALDDVVDFAEEAADQLGLYGVEATTEQSLEMAEVPVRTGTRRPAARPLARSRAPTAPAPPCGWPGRSGAGRRTPRGFAGRP